jgi:trk system potassium uptake protein TrkH
MRLGVTFRIVGRLLMFFSLTMLPPLFVSVFYEDGAHGTFIYAACIIFASGFALNLCFRQFKEELRTKDGFLVTVLCYLTLGSFSALPFASGAIAGLSVVDALFESFSGLTTTGATVLSGLEYLPASILFYRQQLQWLGGMGIIVLAVAILPMLGIGGMQLYRTETPGPVKDSKLTPRIKQTAIALWSIYLSLTLACCFAYYLAGMNFFQALCHSFSTVAIGGFSTFDASLGHFDSASIEMVAMIFMLLSSINFALHFFSFRDRTLKSYWRDEEVRTFFLFMVAAVAVVTMILASETGTGTSALRLAAFHTVSMLTTTGFVTDHFASWPNVLPYLLILGAFVGACAGSTGGGLKMIRVLLIYKQGLREVHRLIHPNAVFPIKVSQRVIGEPVMEAVWGFCSIYLFLFLVLLIILLGTGLDFLTAFSAVAAAINNLGPGLGDVAETYLAITDTAKISLIVGMVAGRLEIFTILVLFSSLYWRK